MVSVGVKQMKVIHWVMRSGSGMERVANDLSMGERSAGILSATLDCNNPEEIPAGLGADIHVIHTSLPLQVNQKKVKNIWVIHATPEGALHNSLIHGNPFPHGATDYWMLNMHLLKECDAAVSFWPRQQAIWQSLMDKGHTVYCIPMGIDLDFWKPVQSAGRFAGSPSLMFAENCYYYKWPLDLFIAYPWVIEEFPFAKLHAFYIPLDQHRWWFPLVNRNGVSYRSYINGGTLSQEALRNAFSSVDYYLNLVKYGDFNHICLEAKASGCKVISYEGNPYADYWVTEGDQRRIARQLIEIFKKEVEPRKTDPVLGIDQMVNGMIEVYDKISK